MAKRGSSTQEQSSSSSGRRTFWHPLLVALLDWVLGDAHLYRAEQRLRVAARHMTLVVLAPRITNGFRADVRRLRMRLKRVGQGVYEIRGCVFRSYLIETDTASVQQEPLLTMVSQMILRDRSRIMEEMADSGYTNISAYVVQQLHRFRGESWIDQMGRNNIREMEQMEKEIRASLHKDASPKQRIELLRGLPKEERTAMLRGLFSGEAFQADAAEHGLTSDQIEWLINSVGEREASKKVSKPGKTTRRRK